ncbi:hypothetical protein ACLOAV_002171 [Pseudogymnoascus australis]
MPPSQPPPPPIYPLYNTTYNLHRLSPLHAFHPSLLPTHTTALHEILTGSTLRGVRIGLSPTDAALSRAGALQRVSMRPLRSPSAWDAVHAAELDDTAVLDEEEGGWGVIIEIVYEKANYTAILLRDISASSNTNSANEGGEFAHLPLLLTRLPPPLRTTLLDFLATRFDTRASPLHLSSSFLKGALGGYIDALIAGGGDVKGAVGDVVVSLAFPTGDVGEGGELKSIDITIPRADLDGFLERGTNTTTSSTTAPAPHEQQHPLWTSLSKHLSSHLSLSLSNPSVAVTKIACGAFVMAREGRVKVSAPGGGRGRGKGRRGCWVGWLAGRGGRGEGFAW